MGVFHAVSRGIFKKPPLALLTFLSNYSIIVKYATAAIAERTKRS